MTSAIRPSSFVLRRSRAGLSLLEVLFAIFVAAVGLLGLAALLTVGGVHTAQSEQADRSAACARAAFRDVEGRDMLHYGNWLDAAGVNQITYASPPGRVVVLADVPNMPAGGLNRARLDAFIIDPLLIAENGPAPPDADGNDGRFFPYRAEVDATLRLPRLTLKGLYNQTDLPFSRAVSDRVFVCRDDINFFEFTRGGRPNIGPDDDNDGTVDSTDKNGVLDPNEMPSAPLVAGNYSYFVMVTPSEAENPYPNQPLSSPPNPLEPLNLYVKSVPIGQRRLFTIQVVVFHRRAAFIASPPSERQAKALVSISGQSALLEPPSADPAYIRGLAANQWILLSATLQPPTDLAYPTESSLARPIHRWVRITSIGRAPSPNQALVNFSGPSWNTQITQPTNDQMSNGNDRNAVATIVDGIVGVYERTVELDARSLTAP